jgi:hypothetical protein
MSVASTKKALKHEIMIDGVVLSHMVPLALPEIPERHFLRTQADVLVFYEKFDRWDGHELVLRRALDGRYVVDIEPLAGGDRRAE